MKILGGSLKQNAEVIYHILPNLTKYSNTVVHIPVFYFVGFGFDFSR